MNNILIISDVMLTHTGVANQSSEVAKALVNKGYKVFNLGSGGVQPNKKLIHTFQTGEQVTVYTSETLDNVPLILDLIHREKINALILVTDPHRFYQVWLNNRTIRNLVPIIYWNLWDTNLLPAPNSKKHHYNEWIYESCDSLPCISQQSTNFVKQIINNLPEIKRPKVSYIPHGSNENVFKPLSPEAVARLKQEFWNGKDFEYVVLLNGRNQTRKKICDLIYAWRLFIESLAPAQAAKCALLLHTEAVSPNGTDLNEVVAALAPNINIIIDAASRSQEQLNILYNIADVTFNVSNAEGFGLPIQESLLAGTPIAATATGGLQDSIGFQDEAGNLIQFTKDFTSNNIGTYRNHGNWSFPLFPASQSIIGSPQTPYLFDDDLSHSTILDGLLHWYRIPAKERKQRGLQGRNYCLTNQMSVKALADNFTKEVKETINNYKPCGLFELFKS